MSDEARQLLEQALRLSAEERSELTAKLLRSFEDDEEAELSPEEWERAWAQEINRRIRDIRTGKTKLIDGDKVLREARALLKPHK